MDSVFCSLAVMGSFSRKTLTCLPGSKAPNNKFFMSLDLSIVMYLLSELHLKFEIFQTVFLFIPWDEFSLLSIS